MVIITIKLYNVAFMTQYIEFAVIATLNFLILVSCNFEESLDTSFGITIDKNKQKQSFVPLMSF